MHYIDLHIPFKIPSFARSITIPNSETFLIGGEEPEYITRKEVYVYDPTTKEPKMIEKAPMNNKKFDFS